LAFENENGETFYPYGGKETPRRLRSTVRFLKLKIRKKNKIRMRRGIFVFPEERVRRFRIRQSAVDFYDSYVFRPAIRRASPVTIREYFPKVNIVDS